MGATDRELYEKVLPTSRECQVTEGYYELSANR